MKEEAALVLAERIISAIPGWSEDGALELIHEIQCWGDEFCAEAAVTTLCRTWTDTRRPTLGKVIEFYNLALEERKRRLSVAGPRPAAVTNAIPPKQGREIAFQSYRQSLGLPDDAETRARYRWTPKQQSQFVEGQAPDVDVDRLLAAIGKGTTYPLLVVLFHGDNLRTRRAIRTLEKRRVITHDDTGWIKPVHATAQ